MRQFHCNANNDYFGCVFFYFSSVETEFCIEEKFGIKLALVSISYVTLL